MAEIETIRPELGTVQETLLLPLLGRADFSRRQDVDFSDPEAEALIDRLDFDRRKARVHMGEAGLFAMAVRAQKMDRALLKFIAKHPDGVIVNLGAGLDTAFRRVDNGRIRWYDLDLPDSIALRRRLLPEGPRNTCIESSMFDPAWIHRIGDRSKGVFLQVPGVFPYIPKATVRKFFIEFPPLLPGAGIIFDMVSPWSARMVNLSVNRSGMAGTEMTWGASDARIIANWSPHVEVVCQEPYFRNVDMGGRLRPSTRWLMRLNDWGRVGLIFQLRFI